MADTTCPFCGISSSEALVIQLHIDEIHSENVQAPAQVAWNGSQSNGWHAPSELANVAMPADWTKCTRPGCGEYVLLSDIDEHLDVHAALSAADGSKDEENRMPAARPATQASDSSSETDAKSSTPKSRRRKLDSSNSKHKSRDLTLLQYFSGTSYHGRPRPRPAQRYQPPRPPGRLGRRELGPHAFEKEMPSHVRRHLLNDALPHYVNKLGRGGRLVRERIIHNETLGVIPVLADICAHDRSTETTYFCHPSTKHVNKLRCDGNFCGYWNIQMLLSYQQATSQQDIDLLPDVLQIQDQIEQAWDNNICAYGRTETGGIRGTRKWIGTSETVAYFTQTGSKIEAHSFQDEEEELAVVSLLDFVETYLISGIEDARSQGTSHITQLPPIYFQRLGHSMTIVGVERKKDGSKNLLVFDPSFETSASMWALLDGRRSRAETSTLMKAYRRSDQSLARWDGFEIVALQPARRRDQ